MRVLPRLAGLTFYEVVLGENVDGFGIACRSVFRGFLPGLRRLIDTPQAGQRQQERAAAQTCGQTDPRGGGPVTAVSTVVSAAEAAILQRQEIGSR